MEFMESFVDVSLKTGKYNFLRVHMKISEYKNSWSFFYLSPRTLIM